MKNNKTLVIVKPDAVKNGNIGEILTIIEKHPKLTITNIKMISVTQNQAKDFYREHQNKPFFQNLIDYITLGPVVVLIISGLNAIKEIRRLCGNTNPQKADSGTIRHLFGKNIEQNAIHSSDSKESFKRERHIIFGDFQAEYRTINNILESLKKQNNTGDRTIEALGGKPFNENENNR